MTALRLVRHAAPHGVCALIVFALLCASHQVNAQRQPGANAAGDRFLRAVAPLDEPRGLCVDIPGHRDRVNVKAPLVVHTCKWSIWNLDERFDGEALAREELRMPGYGLCLGVQDAKDGAKILLGDCDGAATRRWTYSGKRLRIAADPKMCLTIGSEPSALTPGGRRLPSRHVARSLALQACNEAANDRQNWQLVTPNR